MSQRPQSFSRYLAEECGRVLTAFGCEVRICCSDDRRSFDRTSFDLENEQHGAMTAVLKNQVLAIGEDLRVVPS